MMKLAGFIAGMGLLCVAGLAGAGGAVADPPTATMADAVVAHLQSEGYNIQFNMPSNMPLSSCTVSAINGLTITMTPEAMSAMTSPGPNPGTLTIDLNCPDSNN
jgi:hypothetical protein